MEKKVNWKNGQILYFLYFALSNIESRGNLNLFINFRLKTVQVHIFTNRGDFEFLYIIFIQ